MTPFQPQFLKITYNLTYLEIGIFKGKLSTGLNTRLAYNTVRRGTAWRGVQIIGHTRLKEKEMVKKLNYKVSKWMNLQLLVFFACLEQQAQRQGSPHASTFYFCLKAYSTPSWLTSKWGCRFENEAVVVFKMAPGWRVVFAYEGSCQWAILWKCNDVVNQILLEWVEGILGSS